tara:strand:+ start:206 stop:343 length:138 start_codon:yes stop_codon:yes gene_type:complete
MSRKDPMNKTKKERSIDRRARALKDNLRRRKQQISERAVQGKKNK